MRLHDWRDAWRRGYAPLMSMESLQGLAADLVSDSPALLQGATVAPPLLWAAPDAPAVGACPLGRCGMHCGEAVTLEEVAAYFGRTMDAAAVDLGGYEAAAAFPNWWDSTPRDLARALLLDEVRRTLERRSSTAAAVSLD